MQRLFHRAIAALVAVGIISALAVAGIFLSERAQKPIRDQQTILYLKTFAPPTTDRTGGKDQHK